LPVDSDKKVQINLAETPFQGYHQWVLSTFVWAMVFKISMTGVWFFLQGFIELEEKYYK
jgi:hypothetical protein